MRNKIMFILSVLALGALLAACGPTTIVQEPQPQVRTLTVTGSAQSALTPDIAYISIGVHTEYESAAEAAAENKALARQVAAALESFDVDPKDIQTTNYSIWQQYQYDNEGNQTGMTYVVDNTVYVTVRDLEKMGDLLDAAIQAGANSIYGITFDVADKTEALSQVRIAAVENAVQQAQEISAAAGATLGDVQTISFYDNYPAPVYMEGKGMSGGGGGVSVSPGQTTISVTVTIVYELK